MLPREALKEKKLQPAAEPCEAQAAGGNLGNQVERKMQRKHVNKHKAAKQFRHDGRRTKAINVESKPQRGGWRL